MNERIRQLERQATDYYSNGQERIFDRQKFAELIVQECIDIIAPYTVRMSRPGEEYLHPIPEIREHFGVRE